MTEVKRFRDKKPSPTQKRRRDLVLELSRPGSVPVSEIENLSPQVARFYAAAGDRMLQRDLNAIAKIDLINRIHGKVRAKKYVIQAFLPARAQEERNKDAQT